MKKSNLRYLLITTLAILATVAVSVYSCEKQEFSSNTNELISDDPTRFITEPGAICGDMIKKNIVKDDGRTVGEALIYNDTKYFYVIMTSNKGYLFGNAYMHVAGSMKEIPTDGDGNPIIENYEYSIDSKPSSTMRKFRVPIKDISSNNFLSVGVQAEFNTNRPEKPIMAWIQGQLMGEKTGQSFTYVRQICLTNNAQSNDATE